jgi:hypothetical protein
MALQKDEVYKGYTANYWALDKMQVDFSKNSAYVTLALYKDVATCEADRDGNKLKNFDYGFDIGSADFAAMYNPANTIQDTLGMVFMYIMAYPNKDDPEAPPYFSDAQLVP